MGDYRSEHLFTLGQSLTAYRYYQTLISASDGERENQLKRFDSQVNVNAKPLSDPKVRRRKFFNNQPSFDLRGHLYRIFGIDLTEVPGINGLTAHTFLAEIGPDLPQFRSASAFASWLGLCLHNDISGGIRAGGQDPPRKQPGNTGISDSREIPPSKQIMARDLFPPNAS